MKRILHNSDIVRGPSPERAFADSDLGRRLMRIGDSGSSSQQVIADHLLRNPARMTAWSIEDLSAQTGVSTATLSRFARTVGFRGYPELRTAVAETLQAIIQPVEKLRDTFERPGSTAVMLTSALEATLANVRSTAGGLSPDAIASVVARLASARSVYVMGFGLSAHLAGILTLGLQPFCPQLVNVVEFGGTEVAAGRLMNVGSDDVAIVISLPRYAGDAVQLAAYARDRGAHVVAITDSPASPLARLAAETILAPSQHPVLSSSIAPALVAVEALIAEFMLSNRDNVSASAKLTEAISPYLYRPTATPPARSKKATLANK